MFKHELVPDLKLKQITLPERRYYETDDGRQYQSVTTLLGKLPEKKKILESWRARVGDKEADRIKNIAGKRGTIIHDALESYLHNEADYMKDLMPVHKVIVMRMANKLKEQITGKVYGIESGLYSNTLKTAGTVDLIADWKDEITVCDFKTSKRLKSKKQIVDYFLQATAYAIMLRERHGIIAKNICILMHVDNDGVYEYIEKVSRFEKSAMKIFPILAEK